MNMGANDKPSFPALLEAHKQQIALALPKHLSADRMARIALTCFRTTPKLGECDPTSVFAAVIQAAQLGLEPGLNGRCYLIPYGNTCTFVPGWKGLVELVNRSGRASVWTGVIYQGQKFDYKQGDSPSLTITDISNTDDPQLIAYTYAVGRVKGADQPIIEVWSKEKLERHRDKYNKVGKAHYSYKHWEMYARKIPLLQVIKYLPATPELEAALILNDAAEVGAQHLTIKDAIEGTFVPVPAEEVVHEHEGMKAAKNIQELASIFNAMTPEEKKAHKTYYEIRHQEFVEAS
jgi:recombination protein RecT